MNTEHSKCENHYPYYFNTLNTAEFTAIYCDILRGGGFLTNGCYLNKTEIKSRYGLVVNIVSCGWSSDNGLAGHS